MSHSYQTRPTSTVKHVNPSNHFTHEFENISVFFFAGKICDCMLFAEDLQVGCNKCKLVFV